jgi:hypothetical protein
VGNIIDVEEVILELGLSSSNTEEERSIAGVAIQRVEGIVKRYLKYDPSRRTHTEFYPQSDFRRDARIAVWEINDTNAFQRRRVRGMNDELQIQHLPIRSITDLRIDFDGRHGTQSGAFAASTQQVEGTDFWPNYDGEDDDGNSICRDGIIRSAGAWPTEPGSIKIVYIAGYSDAELHGQGGVVDASPITDVIISESIRKIKKAFVEMKQGAVGFVAGPMMSETLGNYKYVLDSAITTRLFGNEWNLMPDSLDRLNDFVNYGMSY